MEEKKHFPSCLRQAEHCAGYFNDLICILIISTFHYSENRSSEVKLLAPGQRLPFPKHMCLPLCQWKLLYKRPFLHSEKVTLELQWEGQGRGVTFQGSKPASALQPELPLQGTQVPSMVREPRSCTLCDTVKKLF